MTYGLQMGRAEYMGWVNGRIADAYGFKVLRLVDSILRNSEFSEFQVCAGLNGGGECVGPPEVSIVLA